MNVASVARRVPLLAPEDPVSKAAELLRESPYAALPVVDGGRLMGVVTGDNLLGAIDRVVADPEDAPRREEARGIPVGSVMTSNPPCIHGAVNVSAAAAQMHRLGTDTLPVVDDFLAYRGMVSEADLVSALCRAIRPPSIGGMATPLGVYLHTGNARAGAGDFGLILTGACLYLLGMAAHWTIVVALYLYDRAAGTGLAEIYLSPVVMAMRGAQGLEPLFNFVEIILFLIYMRMLPLTGYHAAEHQTVHSIERGEPLRVDIVRTMPRPHPRCGTNLVAAAVIFVLVAGIAGKWWIAILATLIGWRPLGKQVQQFFTTRPATDKQLCSGIRAGEEILDNYHHELGRRAGWPERIWNMGIIQAGIGMGIVWALSQLVTWLVEPLI